MKVRYAIAAVLLAFVACSSVHPVNIQQGERCYRCRRNIQDMKLAAQLVDQQGAPFPFRSSGCLAKYLKDHPGENGTTFVADHNSGHLFAADKGYFVPVELKDPDAYGVESDYFAFDSQKDANAAAKPGTKILRWNEVLAAAQ